MNSKMNYYAQLNHLVVLAKTPGFKEYAWSRAKELESCSTGMWQGIAQELVAHMKAQQPASLPAPRKRGR